MYRSDNIVNIWIWTAVLITVVPTGIHVPVTPPPQKSVKFLGGFEHNCWNTWHRIRKHLWAVDTHLPLKSKSKFELQKHLFKPARQILANYHSSQKDATKSYGNRDLLHVWKEVPAMTQCLIDGSGKPEPDGLWGFNSTEACCRVLSRYWYSGFCSSLE